MPRSKKPTTVYLAAQDLNRVQAYAMDLSGTLLTDIGTSGAIERLVRRGLKKWETRKTRRVERTT